MQFLYDLNLSFGVLVFGFFVCFLFVFLVWFLFWFGGFVFVVGGGFLALCVCVCVCLFCFFHESRYFVLLKAPTSTKQLKASKYQDVLKKFFLAESEI